MAYEKIDVHPLNLEKCKQNFIKIAPPEEASKFLAFIREITIEKALTERRQARLINDMALFFRVYRNPIKMSPKLKEEFQQFKSDLLNNKIVQTNGKKYSDAVKEGLTETIVRYLEWKHPTEINKLASGNKPFRKWFIMRMNKFSKTPEILTEAEIKKLYRGASLLWQKFTIAVLFGSGARIEEFLNSRFEDYQEPSKNFPYYQLDIKEEYSKTLGRKVGLYWEYCTEAITKYFESIEKMDPKERVIPFDYDSVRIFLTRLGQKVLNKRIHAHMFRKSSATFYASKLNRQQLCKKFGWRFSSDVVDVYINRAGVDEFEVKDVILNDDISVLRKENLELQTKQQLTVQELQDMKGQFKFIIKTLLSKKDFSSDEWKTISRRLNIPSEK